MSLDRHGCKPQLDWLAAAYTRRAVIFGLFSVPCFNALVRSHRSYHFCFQQQAAVSSKKALINPLYVIFPASVLARYFSQEVVETKTKLKGE